MATVAVLQCWGRKHQAKSNGFISNWETTSKPPCQKKNGKTPTAAVNFDISKPLQKRSPLSQVKVQNIKIKHHLESLCGALETSGGTSKCQTSTTKYRVIFSETFEPLCSTCIWNLCVEPFNLNVEPWSEPSCGTFTWKSLCEAFIRSLHDKPFCETFMWNLYVELQEPESLGNPGTFKSGPFMWNLGKPEPLCGTGELLSVEPLFMSGTFMWNLGKPGARFQAAAPNHPKEPQTFKLLGKTTSFFGGSKHPLGPVSTARLFTLKKQKNMGNRMGKHGKTDGKSIGPSMETTARERRLVHLSLLI